MKIFGRTLIVGLLVLSSCKKNPINRLTNPLPDGDVPQSSGIYGIYNNELLTGGGLGLIPGAGNQSVNFSDVSEPRLGTRQISYYWNGGDVFDPNLHTSSHTFAGFSLLIAQDFASLDSTPAKDLSSFGYTKLTLYVRGSLSDNTSLRIEGPSVGGSLATPARVELTQSQLTNSWQKVTLTVPSGDFSSVKVYMTVSFQYAQPPRTTNPGEGGTVFINVAQYER